MRRVFVPILFVVALSVPVLAQDTDPEPGDWTFQLTPYLLGAGLDGEVGIGSVVGEVDSSFSDILSNLDFGAMVAFRAQRDRFAILADVIFIDLSGSDSLGPADADIDVEEMIVEIDAAYELNKRLDVFGGLRIASIDADVRVEVDLPLGGRLRSSGSESETWVDPVFGVHWTIPFRSDRWAAWLRGDIGGFGVGSDFVWNFVGGVRYQINRSIDLALAYRILDYDYEDGSGRDRFLYKTQTAGPAFAVSFRF